MPSPQQQVEGYKAQLRGERESHPRQMEQHRVELDIVLARAEAAEAQAERWEAEFDAAGRPIQPVSGGPEPCSYGDPACSCQHGADVATQLRVLAHKKGVEAWIGARLESLADHLTRSGGRPVRYGQEGVLRHRLVCDA